MDRIPIARLERAALADALLERGPDAPTLCEGWTNYDMAAHLVVRERAPQSSIGIVVPSFASLHDKAIVRAKRRHSFDELVGTFRSGPPLHWKPVDNLFNGQEYFVHHEDVRRGSGDHTPRPESEMAGIEPEMWKLLARRAKFFVRGIKGVGVDLVDPGRDEEIHARRGEPTVSIVGRPGELILYLFGRRTAAQVTLEGPPEAVTAVEGAKLGI